MRGQNWKSLQKENAQEKEPEGQMSADLLWPISSIGVTPLLAIRRPEPLFILSKSFFNRWSAVRCVSTIDPDNMGL